jgi:hypothetical protein
MMSDDDEGFAKMGMRRQKLVAYALATISHDYAHKQ